MTDTLVVLQAMVMLAGGGLPAAAGLLGELRPNDEGDMERLEGWCVEAWDVVIRYVECL